MINHVHSNSTKNKHRFSLEQTQRLTSPKYKPEKNNKNNKKIELSSKESLKKLQIESIRDTNINRISRYQQHCQSKTSNENNEFLSEIDKTNLLPNKKTENTSNLGIMLKNSLSASTENSPALLRVSRSCTPTPLLQSVSFKNSTGNENKTEVLTSNPLLHQKTQKQCEIYENNINELKAKLSHRESSLSKSSNDENVKCNDLQRLNKVVLIKNKTTLNDLNSNTNNNSSNNNSDKEFEKLNNKNIEIEDDSNHQNYSNTNTKTAALENNSSLIGPKVKLNGNDLRRSTTNIEETKKENDFLSRKLSLGRLSTNISNSTKNSTPKSRRKSLSSYIRESAATAASWSSTLTNQAKNNLKTLRLSFQNINNLNNTEPNKNTFKNNDNKSNQKVSTNENKKDELAYDRLSHDSMYKITNYHNNMMNGDTRLFEPEPDYWDVPYNNNPNNLKVEYTSEQESNSNSDMLDKRINNDKNSLSSSSDINNKKNKLTKSHSAITQVESSNIKSTVKKTVSLAEVIVKSISSNSSRKSTENSSNSSNSSKDKKFKMSKTHINSINIENFTENGKPVMRIFKKNSLNSTSSNASSSNNEEIIVHENIQIVKQENVRKYLQSPNIENNLYSNLDDDKDTSLIEKNKYYNDNKTNNIMKIYQINNTKINDEENKNQINDFEEDFPQPPTQSFLKLVNMEINNETPSPMPPTSNPPPPPPPPPPLSSQPSFSNKPPQVPPAAPPLRSLSLTCSNDQTEKNNNSKTKDKNMQQLMTLNTETLIMAKQKLKISSERDASTSLSCNSKSNTNNTLNNNSDQSLQKLNQTLNNKKNDFLLQEIQNHRLYNTKKDYVLEFLDRSTISSTKIASSSTSSTDSDKNNNYSNNQKFNRSLSNININKSNETPENTNKNEKSQQMDQVKIENNKVIITVKCPNTTVVEGEQPQNSKSSNYERFPYIRKVFNQNKNFSQFPIFSNNVISKNSNENKRVQSNSCLPNNRISFSNVVDLKLNNVNKNDLINNENKEANPKKSNSTSNNIVKPPRNNPNSNTNLSEKVNIANESTKNSKLVVQRSSSAAPSNSSDHKQTTSRLNGISEASSNRKSIESFAETSNYQEIYGKKFRHIVPTEKMESELDRVFKVSFNLL